jgi:hypothetical protein
MDTNHPPHASQQDRPSWLLEWNQLQSLSSFSVAQYLSRINRYCGRSPQAYSVARHSRLVVHLLPDGAPLVQRKWALLHDAHEGFIGDIPRPLEVWMGEEFAFKLRSLRARIDAHLFWLMGVFPTEQDLAAVALADHHACALEMALLGKCDSTVFDALPDNPEAAFELTVLGRPELDAADWRQMWETFSSESP